MSSSVHSIPSELGKQSDEELIALVRGGTSAAFAVLYRRHFHGAATYARRFSNADIAQDVVQESFLKIYKIVRDGGGPRDGFLAYLMTSVRNELTDRARRGSSIAVDEIEDFTARAQDTSELVEMRFEHERVQEAFANLPQNWQQVLWYLEVEQLPPRAIADQLRLTPNAVSQLARRARQGLRTAWFQSLLHVDPARLECRPIVASMSAYLSGQLTPARAEAVRGHVDDCEDCSSVLAELNDMTIRRRALIIPVVLASPLLLDHLSDAVAYSSAQAEWADASGSKTRSNRTADAGAATGAQAMANGSSATGAEAASDETTAPDSGSASSALARSSGPIRRGSGRAAARAVGASTRKILVPVVAGTAAVALAVAAAVLVDSRNDSAPESDSAIAAPPANSERGDAYQSESVADEHSRAAGPRAGDPRNGVPSPGHPEHGDSESGQPVPAGAGTERRAGSSGGRTDDSTGEDARALPGPVGSQDTGIDLGKARKGDVSTAEPPEVLLPVGPEPSLLPEPSASPSSSESLPPVPTTAPPSEPTQEPTETPTSAPTQEPTETPTSAPTQEPTQEPTETPTSEPTQEPTETPTSEPPQVPSPTVAGPPGGSYATPIQLNGTGEPGAHIRAVEALDSAATEAQAATETAEVGSATVAPDGTWRMSVRPGAPDRSTGYAVTQEIAGTDSAPVALSQRYTYLAPTIIEPQNGATATLWDIDGNGEPDSVLFQLTLDESEPYAVLVNGIRTDFEPAAAGTTREHFVPLAPGEHTIEVAYRAGTGELGALRGTTFDAVLPQ